MFLLNNAICCNKKLRYIKEQEASESLSSLGMKKPILSNAPRVNILF